MLGFIYGKGRYNKKIIYNIMWFSDKVNQNVVVIQKKFPGPDVFILLLNVSLLNESARFPC